MKNATHHEYDEKTIHPGGQGLFHLRKEILRGEVGKEEPPRQARQDQQAVRDQVVPVRSHANEGSAVLAELNGIENSQPMSSASQQAYPKDL